MRRGDDVFKYMFIYEMSESNKNATHMKQFS